ncbi:MAG: hypothetical protein WAT19_01460 [Ferruginibacter sp.]
MSKFLNFLLLLAFQFCYLQWGKDSHAFIYEGTAEIFRQSLKTPLNFLHPAILVPFTGEILILATLFRKKNNRVFTLTGLACMGLLILLLFIIGILSMNMKITLSTIPFFITAVFVLRQNRKKKTASVK